MWLPLHRIIVFSQGLHGSHHTESLCCAKGRVAPTKQNHGAFPKGACFHHTDSRCFPKAAVALGSRAPARNPRGYSCLASGVARAGLRFWSYSCLAPGVARGSHHPPSETHNDSAWWQPHPLRDNTMILCGGSRAPFGKTNGFCAAGATRTFGQPHDSGWREARTLWENTMILCGGSLTPFGKTR